MIIINTAKTKISSYYSTHSFFFPFYTLADCIIHNATWPLNDMTADSLSDYTQFPLEPLKVLHYFFTYAVVLYKTCKHTSVLKLVELAFNLGSFAAFILKM